MDYHILEKFHGIPLIDAEEIEGRTKSDNDETMTCVCNVFGTRTM